MTARRRLFTAKFKKRVALDALRGDVTVEGLAEVFSAGRKADADEALVKELHAPAVADTRRSGGHELEQLAAT